MSETSKTIHEVKETLNEYFKLKQKYESGILANKKKIMNNKDLSNREKRREFLKLKPKCINCKRPGGTIFKILFKEDDDNTDSYREYNASCGIIANPCDLKIKIQCGTTELFTDILQKMENDIKNIKNEIIDDKNKLLFGFIETEEAINRFEQSKELITMYTSYYDDYLTKYNSIFDNEDKKRQLEEETTNSYIQINLIKECIKKSNETGNNSFIRDAIQIYDTSLMPILNTIRNLKYSENYVYHNENNNSRNLIQNKFTLSNMLYSGFQSSVINYEFGYNPKNKELSIETDEDPIDEQSKANSDISRDEPIYEDGTVSWNKPQYKKLWEKLPIKFKTTIIPDKEWMNDFMFTCVNARNKGKPCEIIAPKNLIIPPNKLEDETYDFGVKIYSDTFNKLNASTKNTYLSLFTTKNGEKDYSLLINTMNNLIAKETNFESGYF